MKQLLFYESPSTDVIEIGWMESTCQSAAAPGFTVDSYTADWDD